MVRIAITLNTSWNIYNFRLGIIRELLSQGVQVIAIAPADEFSPLLEKEGCLFIPLPMENKGSNPLSDLALLRRLYTIYKANKPDLVLQYTIKPNIYGTIAATLAGVPVINNVSGLGTVFLHQNLVSKIARLLYKGAFRFPKKVFFQNAEDRQLFVEAGLVRKEKTDLLPGSGVNVGKFVPAPTKGNERFTFLLIARLLYDKGIVEYAEAAKIIKKKNLPVRIQLLGSFDASPLGVTKERVESWVHEGLLEYIPFQKDIRPFIAEADCVVLPSYREGTPKTLLEAAAMAKPLIATDVPGCKDVVEVGVNGYLCHVKDAIDLAEKMMTMFHLPKEELNRLGENSRKMVLLKYDEKIVINKYFESINEILRGKAKLDLV